MARLFFNTATSNPVLPIKIEIKINPLAYRPDNLEDVKLLARDWMGIYGEHPVYVLPNEYTDQIALQKQDKHLIRCFIICE
jgi:hypothetical protein